MIVHIQKILKKSQKGGYAVGAFNTSNLEVTLGICRAAMRYQSPIIMQVSEATIEYAGIEVITAIVNSIAKGEAKNVPIALVTMVVATPIALALAWVTPAPWMGIKSMGAAVPPYPLLTNAG